MSAGRLGIPPEWSCSAKAPYDVLADTLRGTKGIMIDRFRQPEKILSASERFVPLMIDQCVRQAAWAESPLVIFWLHKGSDSFMSEADFKTFYWPTLKAVMKGLIDQGLVPTMFAQGSYNKRLDIIADDELPEGSAIWLLDQTDMAAAKRALGGYACIAGQRPDGAHRAGQRRRGGAVRHRRLQHLRQGRRLLAAQRRRAGRRQAREPQGHDRDRAQLEGLARRSTAPGRRLLTGRPAAVMVVTDAAIPTKGPMSKSKAKQFAITEDFPTDALSWLMATCSKTLRERLAVRFTKAGYAVTPEQWAILGRLGQEDGLSQQALADRFHRSKVAAFQLISKLEKQGLVVRRSDPGDGRSNLVFLTDEGRGHTACPGGLGEGEHGGGAGGHQRARPGDGQGCRSPDNRQHKRLGPWTP